MAANLEKALVGCIIGTAVGDALGLPAEGLSPARFGRLFPGPWRHRLLLNRGMYSDDTEHTFFVAQSLLASRGDAEKFQRHLARRLRWWIVSCPAGVGLATLRACLKLWVGFSPKKSGVYSAGNGPAMRAAVIGAYFSGDEDAIRLHIRLGTEITHTDSRAYTGALAVALVTAWSIQWESTGLPAITGIAEKLRSLAPEDEEWLHYVAAIEAAYPERVAVTDFAKSLDLHAGVTGYVYHTVPVAIYSHLLHFGDFRATLEAVLDCGGDADTVGAISGAIAGGVAGEHGIPDEWVSGILEWPRSMGILREAAQRLAKSREGPDPIGPVKYFWPGLILRNAVFLVVVLLHGFRRLAPPY